MGLTVGPIEPADAEACGRIGYEAHKAVSSAHGYPSEQPSEEYGIGIIRMCLSNRNSWGVLGQARKQGHDQVRLVQSPSHIRSFVLYSKCGFALREPLFLMQGQPLAHQYKNDNVRPVQDNSDVSTCNELCRSVHGFSREGELRQAKHQGVAIMIEKDGNISGYAAGVGLFGHAVAKSNDDLMALIASAQTILGPDSLCLLETMNY